MAFELVRGRGHAQTGHERGKALSQTPTTEQTQEEEEQEKTGVQIRKHTGTM